MKIYCYISTQVNFQRKREIDGRKQDNCCISSSDSLVNMYVWVFITLFWCFLVWYTAFLHVYRDYFWLDKMNWCVSSCVVALDNTLTATDFFPSALPVLILSTWQCISPLESDYTTPPLLSNERIRHCCYNPLLKLPPLCPTLILCLLPRLPPPPCTLLSLLVSVV